MLTSNLRILQRRNDPDSAFKGQSWWSTRLENCKPVKHPSLVDLKNSHVDLKKPIVKQNERNVEIHSQWIEHNIEQKARYFILPCFAVPLHIVALRVEYFFQTVLIQDPAHINNFISLNGVRTPFTFSRAYVYTCTSMQFYGPHAGAVISQIKSTDHGRQPVQEWRPRFGLPSITQKLRAIDAIRVLNIIKLKLYIII